MPHTHSAPSTEPHSWLPILGTIEYQAGSRLTFVAAPWRSLDDEPPVHYASVTFPSGALLMADWFAIPEFTNLVDADIEALPSINAEYGRIRLAQHYV